MGSSEILFSFPLPPMKVFSSLFQSNAGRESGRKPLKSQQPSRPVAHQQTRAERNKYQQKNGILQKKSYLQYISSLYLSFELFLVCYMLHITVLKYCCLYSRYAGWGREDYYCIVLVIIPPGFPIHRYVSLYVCVSHYCTLMFPFPPLSIIIIILLLLLLCFLCWPCRLDMNLRSLLPKKISS